MTTVKPAWERLLERFLDPDSAEAVIGDFRERELRGPRLVRETLSALWHLHDRPSAGAFVMGNFAADLRHGVRLLRRSPAFAAASLVTLGLAIGATTAIFSIVRPVLLSRLPYPAPDRLVFVWEVDPDQSHDDVGFATFRDLASQSRTVERAAAVGDWQPTILGNGDSERLQGDRVSWTFFRTLGVQPAMGRDFLESEDAPGRNQVVILSFGLWQRRFAADSSIVGRTISIDGNPTTVVGVMPRDFDNVVSPTTQIWRVLGYDKQPWACRTCHHLRMVARLKPGASLAQAAAEMDAIHGRLAAAYPKEYATPHAAVVHMSDEVRSGYRSVLVALAGAVFFLLLIAVANIVNLQLARAVRRETEFSIRTALGAGRSRLTAQLLAESLVLAALGGTLGVAAAFVALPTLVRALPPGMPRLSAIHVDLGALLLVGAVVMAVATLMGLAPVRAQHGQLADALRAGRGLAGGRHTARSTLVVAEIALAVMLLTGAGLMARSLVRLLSVDTGFDPSHLLTLEVNSVGANYRTKESIYAYHDRVRDAVRALPGVVDVAVANQLPLGGNVDMYGVRDPANPPPNPELAPSGDRYAVSVEYQRTMRIPLLHGRWFTPQEANDSSARVVVVSAALAARLWPGEDPVHSQMHAGRRLQVGGSDSPVRTVIGIVGNVHHRSLDGERMYQWYVPERQWQNGADNQEVLIIRAAGDPTALAASVRRAITAIDPAQPIIKLATMDQVIGSSVATRRLALVLFAAFAAAALLLSVAGVYGVLAGSVAERTREFGVRIAVGATPEAIVRLVLSQAGRLAVIGIVIGIAGAAALTRYLQTLLYSVSATDPETLATVVIALAAVILAACLVPAFRASRVDPSSALRAD
jgi:putative ABC transport system permease protein